MIKAPLHGYSKLASQLFLWRLLAGAFAAPFEAALALALLLAFPFGFAGVAEADLFPTVLGFPRVGECTRLFTFWSRVNLSGYITKYIGGR